jgi:NAD(P)-dependent dehydrogenase (short-subunit alcohol dehydrogenase family)
MNEITQPTALITGASKGLGRALAGALAARGWRLVADARAPGSLAADLPDAFVVPGDVTEPAHRAALAAAVGRLGRLDLLVNNASLLGPSPQPKLVDYDVDTLKRVYDVNVFGPLRLTQLALPLLRASAGHIVNVTSDAAVEGYEGWGGYGSSKAALDQLTAILATEEPQLRVYAVDPGDMRTQTYQQAFPDEDISHLPPPETSVPGLLKLIEGTLPSGRYRARDLVEVSA